MSPARSPAGNLDVPTNRATSSSPSILPDSSSIFWAHNAATPATCGVAMLVPLMEFSPPPGHADKMLTPGAPTLAPPLEKGATSNG